MGIDYTKRPSAPQPAVPPPPPPGIPPPPPAGQPVPPAPASIAPQQSVAPPAAPPPPAAPVSLSKVTLTKSAPSVSLTKHGGSRGMLAINLNWDAKPPEKGFFKKYTQLDLDLGCLYEFNDGSKGVVQALGNAFIASNRAGKQLVRLDGDDRSGRNTGGENMTVDLSDPSLITRVLVFALIYEGAANWAAAKGVATLTPVGAPPIEVLLDDPRDGARICAIAMITNENGEIVVRREVNYLNGAQRALDEAYGWGMNWTRGRK
ncbi:MAG: tellurite resistance protein TerA [Pseudonocardiales bacterium]|jgi:tellurite resistance protein TerA|nr:tellurite resistance protein TerA [Pseudonocardiales bacterium]